MALYLEKQGYTVVNVGYPSRRHRIEELAEMAIEPALEQCSQATAVHFVTHSMGGILLRYYLTKHEIPWLSRAVMLGPPNQGSEVVDSLSSFLWFQAFNGPAGMQLGTDADSIPSQLPAVDFELGVIAGNRSVNWFLSTFLPGDDDGKVTVERTQVEGMQDHKVMPVTHPLMMRNKAVMEQVAGFLRDGQFS